jgi:tripartite-type tricarboxylate transporter receptor subunit TctC
MRNLSYRFFLTLVAVLMLLIPARPLLRAVNAAEFPRKPIIWIVHYGPGGGYDLWSRAIARTMQKHIGVPIAVRNIPGAGGRTGGATLFKSKPDGHTVGMLSAIAMSIAQEVRAAPFKLKKFTWLGAVALEYSAVFVAAKSKIGSVDDLKKLWGGKGVRMGASGRSDANLINALVMADTVGFRLQPVLGLSGSQVFASLLSGDIDIVIRPVTSGLPFVKSGDVRALVNLSPKRSPLLPDVPTAQEVGGGLEKAAIPVTQRMVAAPPGTPPEIQKTLADALLKTLRDPDLVRWAKDTGRGEELDPMPGSEAAKLVSAAIETVRQFSQQLKQYK